LPKALYLGVLIQGESGVGTWGIHLGDDKFIQFVFKSEIQQPHGNTRNRWRDITKMGIEKLD